MGFLSLFLKFARTYGVREEVDKKWDALLHFEANILKNFGDKQLIHG